MVEEDGIEKTLFSDEEECIIDLRLDLSVAPKVYRLLEETGMDKKFRLVALAFTLGLECRDKETQFYWTLKGANTMREIVYDYLQTGALPK